MNDYSSTNGWDFTTKEMPVGEHIKKHKLSKTQGLLSPTRIKKLEPDILAAITCGTIFVDAKGNIICGNHRTEAAKEAIKKGNLNPQHPIKVHVFADRYTARELSKFKVKNNISNAINKKHEQTLLDPAFPVSKCLGLPIFEIFEEAVRNERLANKRDPKSPDVVKRNALMALTSRTSALLNTNPSLVGTMSANGLLGISGAVLYLLKSADEAKAEEMMDVEAKVDLTKHPKALKAIKDAAGKFIRLMGYLQDKQAEDGSSIQALTGSTRTTLCYILYAAALSGRLDQKGVTFEKIYKAFSKHRSAIKTKVTQFPNKTVEIERSISEYLKLGDVLIEEALETDKE
jgi:hypothetical protein